MSQTITARKKKHKNFFVLSDIFKVYGHISRLTLQAPPPLISDRTITKKKKKSLKKQYFYHLDVTKKKQQPSSQLVQINQRFGKNHRKEAYQNLQKS